MRRFLFGAGFLLALDAVAGAPAPALAEGAALVAVVESAVEDLEPAVLRRALSERLGVPVVTLYDSRARSSRGILSIVVDPSGRSATVQFQPRTGRDYVAQVSLDGESERLVEAVVTALRASEPWESALPFEREILDPWQEEALPSYAAAAYATRSSSELIDPYDVSAPRSDVLDPWADTAGDASPLRGRSGEPSRSEAGRLDRPAR